MHTHLALVWTGPKPLIAVYSLKYCGTDKPMKMEKPSMNFVRKLLRLQNWRKLRPPAPVDYNETEYIITYKCVNQILIVLVVER